MAICSRAIEEVDLETGVVVVTVIAETGVVVEEEIEEAAVEVHQEEEGDNFNLMQYQFLLRNDNFQTK